MSAIIAATALTQTVFLYSALMPRPGEMRDMTDPRVIAQTRATQATAGALSLATGIGLAIIDQDSAPLMVTILTVLILSAASETMIRATPITT